MPRNLTGELLWSSAKRVRGNASAASRNHLAPRIVSRWRVSRKVVAAGGGAARK